MLKKCHLSRIINVYKINFTLLSLIEIISLGHCIRYMKSLKYSMVRIRLLFVTLLLSSILFAQEERVKLFPFKSAIVEYKYEASLNGTRVKYIDEWGYKQADYIRKTLNLGDATDKEYQTIILIGEKAYTIDLQENTIAVGRNSTYNYYLLNQNRKCTDVSDALLQSAQGYIPAGTEIFLEKECKVWEAGNSTQYTWNGLMLYSEINFMTMMVEKATGIKVDVDIPEGKFKIPQGLEYISSDTYQGFGGLELNFDEAANTKPETNNNSITVSFNSSDLDGCDNFAYLTESGEKIVTEGINDYNKIDIQIINLYKNNLSGDSLKISGSTTLLFETNAGDFGKMQTEFIDDNEFIIRFVTFNKDGKIKDYSLGDKEVLLNDFDFSLHKDWRRLIVSPKGNARCLAIEW